MDETTGVVLWKQNLNSNLRSTFIENLIFNVTLEGYLVVLDARNGNILRMTNIFERIKRYEKKGLLADKTIVFPIGFIVSNEKIYIKAHYNKSDKYLLEGFFIEYKLYSPEQLFQIKITKYPLLKGFYKKFFV